MSNKSKAPVSRKKSSKDATKHSAKGDTASRTPSATGTRRVKRGVAFDLSSLVSEVRDLRTLRDRYQSLLHEHNGLLGTLKDLSSELGTSAKNAWTNYRAGGAAPASASFRTRVRTSSQDVDAQYDKIVESLPAGWSSKEAICSAAGLTPSEANTAFRRLVTGFKRDGKNHPALLESNGKRGTEGRYRKK
jgi:hypothetical protein